jgi:hypothetical protein
VEPALSRSYREDDMSSELHQTTVSYNGRTRVITTWVEFAHKPRNYGAGWEDWDLGDKNPCFAGSPEEAIDQFIESVEIDYDVERK